MKTSSKILQKAVLISLIVAGSYVFAPSIRASFDNYWNTKKEARQAEWLKENGKVREYTLSIPSLPKKFKALLRFKALSKDKVSFQLTVSPFTEEAFGVLRELASTRPNYNSIPRYDIRFDDGDGFLLKKIEMPLLWNPRDGFCRRVRIYDEKGIAHKLHLEREKLLDAENLLKAKKVVILTHSMDLIDATLKDYDNHSKQIKPSEGNWQIEKDDELKSSSSITNIGGVWISIPNPRFFYVRYDGKNKQIDQLMDSMVDPDSVLLASYCHSQTLEEILSGEDLGFFPRFSARTKKSLAQVNFSSDDFSTMKSLLIENIEKAKKGGSIKHFIASLEKRTPGLVTSKNWKLQFEKGIGVFSETENSISAIIPMSSEVSTKGDKVKILGVSALSMIKVKGKVINLTYIVPCDGKTYYSKLMKRNISAWRDNLIKSNSE